MFFFFPSRPCALIFCVNGIHLVKSVNCVLFSGRRKQSRRFFKDCFISLLELRWRYVIFLFFAAFLMCYGAFAVAYYVLAWSHGDLDNLGKRFYSRLSSNCTSGFYKSKNIWRFVNKFTISFVIYHVTSYLFTSM